MIAPDPTEFLVEGLRCGWMYLIIKWFNNQISPQRFIENVNKPSTFYCININPQCIIFLK